MPVLKNVRALRADAIAILELAGLQKNAADASGLLRYADSLTKQADALEQGFARPQQDVRKLGTPPKVA